MEKLQPTELCILRHPPTENYSKQLLDYAGLHDSMVGLSYEGIRQQRATLKQYRTATNQLTELAPFDIAYTGRERRHEQSLDDIVRCGIRVHEDRQTIEFADIWGTREVFLVDYARRRRLTPSETTERAKLGEVFFCRNMQNGWLSLGLLDEYRREGFLGQMVAACYFNGQPEMAEAACDVYDYWFIKNYDPYEWLVDGPGELSAYVTTLTVSQKVELEQRRFESDLDCAGVPLADTWTGERLLQRIAYLQPEGPAAAAELAALYDIAGHEPPSVAFRKLNALVKSLHEARLVDTPPGFFEGKLIKKFREILEEQRGRRILIIGSGCLKLALWALEHPDRPLPSREQLNDTTFLQQYYLSLQRACMMRYLIDSISGQILQKTHITPSGWRHLPLPEP